MKKILVLLIIASFIVYIIKSCEYSSVEVVPVHNEHDITFYANDSFPNCNSLNDSVKWAIHASNIEHPDIVYAQAILETGYFTSQVFCENNNLFGMKLPKSRDTMATGENLNHATFSTWLSSIEDYKLWQDSFASGKTREEYFKYLGDVYAGDDTYVKKLKQIIKQYDLEPKLLAQN